MQGTPGFRGTVGLHGIRFPVAVGVQRVDPRPQLIQAVRHVCLLDVNDGEGILGQLYIRVGPDQIFVIDGKDSI